MIRKRVVCCVAALVVFGHKTDGALIINLDFSSFSTGAPADGSAILGGGTLAQAQSVIRRAAAVWESVFANSSSSIAWSSNVGGTLTQNISVGWGSLSGASLATGGTSWYLSDGRWAGGTLTWDNDGSSQFFVDPTSFDSAEWRQSSERSLDFAGVSMNVERIQFDAPAGIARDNSDMLSVALHEVGHALGFLSSFPAFDAADAGSDGDIDISSGIFTGAEIPVAGGHTDFQIQTPSTEFPYDPGPGSSFPLFDYNPNVMGPSLVTGTRALLTEADIAVVAEFLEFDMNTVNFSPSLSAVPEPSGLLMLSVLGLGIGIVNRRRRIADCPPNESTPVD